MKELSIEEKARRYDEAIEKLRSLHDDYDCVSTLIDIKKELEYIFPELKESEDERFKNFISNELACLRATDGKSSDRYEELTKAIDWLEKQGGQKPIVIIPKFRVGDIIRCTPLYECDRTMHITSIDERGYNVDYQHLGDNTTSGTIGFAFENDYELVESRLTESEKINLIKMIIEYFRTGVMPDLPQRVKIVTSLKSLIDSDEIREILNTNNLLIQDVNTWLEKQNEHQKFRDSIQVGDKVTRNKDGVLVNLSQLNRVAKKDNMQGEQEPAWKPSGEQIKVCKKVYADILSAKGFDLGTVNSELNRLEEELKELKAQKGE